MSELQPNTSLPVSRMPSHQPLSHAAHDTRHLCCHVTDCQVNAANKLTAGFQPPRAGGGNGPGAWLSTGLWAPAGSLVTVRLLTTSAQLAMARRYLGVAVGSHTASLPISRISLCRPPSTLQTLQWFGRSDGTGAGSDTLTISNPWGGLVYIVVPKVRCCWGWHAAADRPCVKLRQQPGHAEAAS